MFLVYKIKSVRFDIFSMFNQTKNISYKYLLYITQNVKKKSKSLRCSKENNFAKQ